MVVTSETFAKLENLVGGLPDDARRCHVTPLIYGISAVICVCLYIMYKYCQKCLRCTVKVNMITVGYVVFCICCQCFLSYQMFPLKRHHQSPTQTPTWPWRETKAHKKHMMLNKRREIQLQVWPKKKTLQFWQLHSQLPNGAGSIWNFEAAKMGTGHPSTFNG